MGYYQRHCWLPASASREDPMASAITDDFHAPPTRAAAMDGLSKAGPPIRRSEPLKIVYRPIEQLKSDPANPRLHSKKQIRQIAKSIETFGFNVPILVEADGHATGLGAIHHRPFPMAVGEMDKAEFTTFLGQALRNLAASSAAGSLHYVCMDWRHIEELLTAGAEAYGELKNLCVWAKDNAGMGSLYRSQHELVFVFKQRGGAHRNNVQLGQFGRNRSNVWHYPGVNSFARCGEEGNLSALHPTVKPVALVADAILDCTERGGIVIDAFLGSGTTVIAAERTGRRCYGVELDPVYVDTAIRRWQALTGKKACHAASGRSFDDLACEAEAADDDEGDHEVGYGKPPRHSQFVKGQSGNPRGRPPGAKNLKTLLNKALNELVIVTENGGRRKISKREAIVTQLVNRSAKADYKAIQILLGMLRDIEDHAEPGAVDHGKFTEADAQIIQRIRARLRGATE